MFQDKSVPSIGIDFDNTIATWIGNLDSNGHVILGEPKQGAVNCINLLKKYGCYIVIWSSRTSKEIRKDKLEILNQAKKIEEYLKKYNIPYDEIDLGEMGKRPFDFYIDDRNVPFGPWQEMVNFVICQWSENGSIYKPQESGKCQ